eukprot:gene4003-14083_t
MLTFHLTKSLGPRPNAPIFANGAECCARPHPGRLYFPAPERTAHASVSLPRGLSMRVAALAVEDDTASSSDASPVETGASSSDVFPIQVVASSPFNGLPLPDRMYQRQLAPREMRDLRTQSNTMAKESNIPRITVGKNGVTQNFLIACMDALTHQALLRVKMGEGCDLDREAFVALLEKYLDAVCVHQVGFTVTMYRENGLPRPSNLPDSVGDKLKQEKEEKAALKQVMSEEELRAEVLARAIAKSKGRTSATSLERSPRPRPAQAQGPGPPSPRQFAQRPSPRRSAV